ncbi:MAG: 1,4-alpha-glucan branching protein GlgB [Eubacteriales bacterium]|nr:1,4-alpha-glucan branching protein GlgB [Eubacteriales bacterium]
MGNRKKRKLTEKLRAFGAEASSEAYTFMGCHPARKNGQDGFVFRVWAPHARFVQVIGEFCSWDPHKSMELRPIGGGVWEGFSNLPQRGQAYKYHIGCAGGGTVYKSDPYGFSMGLRPDNTSRICDLRGFRWTDEEWCAARREGNQLSSPLNIYEVHLGSWRRGSNGEFLSYANCAKELAVYARNMGYTHIELLPVAEHPYDRSWGYQCTGWFAPSARFGSPRDFMRFVNICHAHGIGVILDWVGAHFPRDECGLFEFDGGYCYEPTDPLLRDHPEWGTRTFDFGRNEVRSFLISSAVYWLDKYHVDGLRVDAVASMLYLDYGRQGGPWRPNEYGGHVNLAAVSLLRDLNRACYAQNPGVLMLAEESTTFPLVTRPDYVGGLGFTFKWSLGWMHDTLEYMSADPLFRKGLHEKLTFPLTYAFAENFVLTLSHDEVVYGKKSLLGKMPGRYEEKLQNLRVLYAYMMASPGKKLLFMGGEFGQLSEWDSEKELDWKLLEHEQHKQLRKFVRDLNRLYLSRPALWENDYGWDGFQWISHDDRDNSVAAFLRSGEEDRLLVVCNFCPIARKNYRLGLPEAGRYIPMFSGDARCYGGTGLKPSPVESEKVPMHGFSQSGRFTLPPLAVVFYDVPKRSSGRKIPKKEASP